MKSFLIYRKQLAMIALLLFSFHLWAVDNALTEGINALKRYKKYKDFQISSGDLKNYLEEAYGFFERSEAPVSRLYLLYTGKKLGKTKELQKTMVTFVINHRSQYLHMIADMRVLETHEKGELKDTLMDIEYRIPFIGDIGLKQNTIHPYGGETPELMFFLNAPAQMALRIDGEIENEKKCDRGGHIFTLTWQDDYLYRERLGWELHAASELIDGSEYGELLLETYIPEQLTVDRGAFVIKGVYPKPETKTSSVRNKKVLTYGILISVAAGGLGMMVKRDSETGYEYSKGQRTAIGLIAAAIGLGFTIYFYLRSAKKKQVPIRENINFNRKLAKKIDKLKEQIKVDMKIKRDRP